MPTASTMPAATGNDPPQRDRPRALRRFLPVAILVAAAVVPYLNSLQGTFHFDDVAVIVRNETIRDFSGLVHARPVSRWLPLLTYCIQYRLGSLENMPPWHIVNILLHAACTLAVFWMMRMLIATGTRDSGFGIREIRNPSPRTPVGAKSEIRNKTSSKEPAIVAAPVATAAPFLGALLFAVHPLAAEAVNYISVRCVEMYALFTILALCGAVLLHQAATTGQRLRGAALLVASIVLACLSKEVGLFFSVAVPGLYFILFVLVPSPNKRRLAARAGVVLLAAAGAAGAWLYFGGAWAAMAERFNETFLPHLWGQMTVFWQYLALAVAPLPSQLTVDHDVSMPIRSVLGHAEPCYTLAQTEVVFSFVGVMLLVLLPLVFLAKRRPLVALLILMLPVGVAPYLFMPSTEMMVEYRFYLSLMAFCCLAGLLLARLASLHRLAAPIVVTALCVLLAVGTAVRNQAWRSDLSLWTDAFAKSPRKARTANALAWVLVTDKKDPDKNDPDKIRGLQLARQSLDKRFYPQPPFNPYMYDTLAEALYANGRYNEAIDLEQKVMEHVLEIKQGDPEFFRSQIKRYVEARDKANGLPHK